MASIFNIDEWNGSEKYQLYDIVYYDLGTGSDKKRFFWYCRTAGVTTSAPTLINTEWAGVKYDVISRENKPEFIWEPSYNLAVDSSPRVISLKFGDGYEQRISDGIHTNLIKISLNFESRNNQEARAISHFLSLRKGKESFLFTPPSPYASEKLFIARNWNYSMKFYNNNDVKTTFEEVTI